MIERIDERLYLSKIPDSLRENKDFMVFMELAIGEFNLDLKNIKDFTDLIDPDKVPAPFLEALGSIVGYENVLNADESFQREILQRVHTIYSQRGTDKSIIMSATHGANEGWVGGDIFIPGYSIESENAKIVFTTDKIFTHCRSKYSGGDVFSDSSMYRPGVILLTVPYIDEKVREAINKNIPAGVRYYFVLEERFNPSSEEDTGAYGELSSFGQFKVVALTEDEKLKLVQEKSHNEYEFFMQTIDNNLDILVHSTRNEGLPKRSGNFEVGIEDITETNLAVSALSLTALKKPFLGVSEYTESEDIEVTERRTFNKSKFSDTDTLSEIHSYQINVIENTERVEEDEPDPNLYLISPSGELLDVKDRVGIKGIMRNLDLVDSFEMEEKRETRIIPCRSCLSSTRGKPHTMSGLLTGCIDNMISQMPITPDKYLYYVSYVEDKRASELSAWDYSPNIEYDEI